jgi:K+-transporting ATPase ATPase C chain
MIKIIIQSMRQLVVWTVITGLAYPIAITVISQAVFKEKANGSILVSGTNNVGSSLLAQQFTGSNYFWPRPSSCTYTTLPSGASNLGPTSGQLKTNVLGNADSLRSAHGLDTNAPVPPELLFASGSGVDPHITPDGALFQVKRVAKSRGIEPEKLAKFVEGFVEQPQFGVFGEPRVNVLVMNLAMDREFPVKP